MPKGQKQSTVQKFGGHGALVDKLGPDGAKLAADFNAACKAKDAADESFRKLFRRVNGIAKGLGHVEVKVQVGKAKK